MSIYFFMGELGYSWTIRCLEHFLIELGLKPRLLCESIWARAKRPFVWLLLSGGNVHIIHI